MEPTRLEDGQAEVTRGKTLLDHKSGSTVELSPDGHSSQLMELCRRLWPGAQQDKTVIDNLGSSQDEVFGIFVIDSSSGRSKAFILRYPYQRPHNKPNDESSSRTLARQVAILRWLGRNTFLKTGKVLCYDTTTDNPIGTPYMVQERLPGVRLQDVLTSPGDGPGLLSLEKRLDLARALGRLFRDLRCITKSRAGTVVASGARPELSNCDPFIAIRPFGAPSSSEGPAGDPGGGCDDTDGVGLPDRARLSEPEPVWLKAKDVVANAFDRRILHYKSREQTVGRERYEHAVRPLVTARGIMERLFRLGLFEDADDNEFSLWHPELSPRNIMVDLSLGCDDMFTGVLGWDDPAFAPSFVSCVPPVWLWAPSTYPLRDGADADHRKTDTAYDLTEPESPDLARVKGVFDREAGDFFVQKAYSRRYIYARALLSWVQFEAWPSPHEERRRDGLLKECQAWLSNSDFVNNGRPDGGNEGSRVADGVSETVFETRYDKSGACGSKLVATG